jgi:hypothetical protein
MNRIIALVRVQTLLALRQFRGGARWANALVSILMGVLGLAASLGMAFGFWFLLRMAGEAGDGGMLLDAWQVVFWSAAFFGLFLPLLRGGIGAGIEPERLLLFPVSRWRLYLFSVATSAFSGSHLFYYPSLAAVTVVPQPAGVSGPAIRILIIGLFMVSLVVWSHALAQVMRVLMTRRRLRELIILGAMVLLILACLLPAAMDRYQATANGGETIAEARGWFAPLLTAAKVFPPSIATGGVRPPLKAPVGGRITSAVVLLLWTAAGMWLGYVQFRRDQHGSTTASARTAPKTLPVAVGDRRLLRLAGFWLRLLPPETRAVALKDLRYLLRSVLGRFSLLMAPVLVLMFVFIFSEVLQRPLPGVDPDRTLLCSTLIYLAFLSNNFFNNAFAWEGGGAQHYFLGPVSLRHVLLGKNIAIWVFNGLIFILAIATWVVVAPLPSPVTLLTGLCVFAVALLLLSLGGNLVSVWFPVGRNPAAFMASPSQAGIFTGIGAVLLTVLLCSAALLLPALAGQTGWQLPALLLLLAVLVFCYGRLLGVAARIWSRRGEKFLDAVKRVV